MYEQLVFLPNSLRNSQVALRFANNGVVQKAVGEIFARGRVLQKPTCPANSALKLMQSGHRHMFGHKKGSANNWADNWTPRKAFEDELPEDWNSKNLSWNGCKLDIEYESGFGAVDDDIPFEDLAREDA